MKEERLSGSGVPENAREVELPVCPRCGNVSRQANQGTSKAFCVGPGGEGHKKTSMALVRYRST